MTSIAHHALLIAAGTVSSTGPLLHFDGANGSTSIIDAHGGSTWVTDAGATLSTAQAKFGGSSLDAGPGYVHTLNMGGSLGTNFTVQGFAFNGGSPRGLFHTFPNSSAGGLALGWSGGSTWELYHNGTNTASSSTTLPVGWFHWAVWRTGGRIRAAINGTIIIDIADAGSLTATTSMYIGAYYNNGFPWDGYIDEVLIDLATAAYGSVNFTPPTAPFT